MSREVINKILISLNEGIKTTILADVKIFMKALKEDEEMAKSWGHKINGKKVLYSERIPSEARNEPTRILIGKKFLELSKEIQEHILIHEACHDVISDFMYDNPTAFADLLETDIFGTKTSDGRFDGLFGNYKLEEAMTDGLTVYMTTPNELKTKYPKAYDYVKKNFKV
jgi:hypothetical protein